MCSLMLLLLLLLLLLLEADAGSKAKRVSLASLRRVVPLTSFRAMPGKGWLVDGWWDEERGARPAIDAGLSPETREAAHGEGTGGVARDVAGDGNEEEEEEELA